MTLALTTGPVVIPATTQHNTTQITHALCLYCHSLNNNIPVDQTQQQS